MEGVYRTMTRTTETYRVRRWTESEWCVVGVLVLCAMAALAVAYVVCTAPVGV